MTTSMKPFTPEQFLSDTARTMKPSGIRRFFDLASQMEDVISLGVGEPDFVTPWNFREASILSLEEGYTAYSPNAGFLELREEISTYMENRFSVAYDPHDEIIVTIGASEALDIGLRAVINPGDEVIVVEPCFVSYTPLVEVAGGKAITVQALPEHEFKIQPEQLKEVITEKTKAIIICSPNNPTGTVLNREELEKIAKVAIRHDLLVFSDEIYAELTYDEEYTSFANIEGMRERTIVMNGFSKAFAMTGWRLGYVCGPKEIIQAMLKIHQYAIMCAPTMSQFAAIEALRNGFDEMKKMVNSYHQRRNYIVKEFRKIGLPCHVPGGAFYVFPDITSTGLSSEEFAERLLIEQHVAVVPGHVFGESGEGHIRCSYATGIEQLEEAMKRIDLFICNYK